MARRTPLGGFRASLVAQGTRIAVNGLIVVLLAGYFLTPTEYGKLFLAISILSTALMWARAGIPKSAARYVTEYRETDPEQVRNIVRISLLAVVFLSVFVGLGIVVFRNAIVSAVNEPTLAPLLVIGFFYICFRSINGYLYTLFQGFNQIERASLISISSYVGLFIAVLSLLWLGFGVVGALSGYVLGYGLGTTVGLLLLYRVVRTYEVRPTEVGLRRRILEYSVPLVATNGANMLYKRVDTILVGFFLGPIAVGYYTLAKQISDFVIAPASSLGFTISPSYAEYKSKGDDHGAARVYEMALEHVVLFYIPAAAGLVLVARPTIQHVFGAEYVGAVPVVQVFAAFIVLQAIDKITNDGLDYLGRARQRAIIKTSTGILNLLLNLALIPAIGVVGAAISTALCYAIMVAVNVSLIHIELSLNIRRITKSFITIFGIAACMSIVVSVLVPFATNLAWLLVVVAVGGAVWAILALASGIPNVTVEDAPGFVVAYLGSSDQN